MLSVVNLVLLVIVTLAWLVWRARRCGSYGCGALEVRDDARNP